MRSILLIFAFVLGVFGADACTSAIVSGKLTVSGRPMLWKNRDTSHLENFVAKVEATDSTHAYIALFNKGDNQLREAWIGVNDAGFAIMNTQSYNLAPDTAKIKDREGLVMSDALARCTSVADFANLLSRYPRPIGIQANFGVIDSQGNGGYFEADDHSYTFYPLTDDEPLLVRTNFSESGGDGGLGYVRYDNAIHLLEPYGSVGGITPALFTEELSRSFYRSDLKRDFATGKIPEVVVDLDFIPRYSTSATVVIEGVSPTDAADSAVMWAAPGYPPCSTVYPATLHNIASQLLPDTSTGTCVASDESMRLKQTLFAGKNSRGKRLLRLRKAVELSNKMRGRSLATYQNFKYE